MRYPVSGSLTNLQQVTYMSYTDTVPGVCFLWGWRGFLPQGYRS